MSEIVKNELDAIKAFETDTEKRRSTLTLNELNYISDKQLHKKDSGGSGPAGDQWPDIPFVFEMDASQAAGGYPPVEVLKSTSFVDLESYQDTYDQCYCLGYLKNYPIFETTINQLYLISAQVVAENEVVWDISQILPGCTFVYTFATDTAEIVNDSLQAS